MSQVRIRPAESSDALALAALTLQDDREQGCAPRPGFLDQWSDAWLAQVDQRPAWLAATADGRPVGMVAVHRCVKLPSLRRPVHQRWHVSLLFVTPDHRGAGLGERLMRTMLGAAASASPHVSAVTLNAAQQARPLYERLGFGPAGDEAMVLRLP